MNYTISQTETFQKWLKSVRDMKARVSIARRIERAANGNLGDHKSLGEGVSEIRADVGAGYRLYYTVRGSVVIILLCGGDKKSQGADIAKAKIMAKEY